MPISRLEADLIEKWRPVRSLKVFKADAMVVRREQVSDSLDVEIARGPRRKIKKFSSKSWVNLMYKVRNTYMIPFSMLTLTYPRDFPLDGRQSKIHLDALLKALRRRFRYIAYIWFLEFQSRGAPHYHLLTTVDLSLVDGAEGRLDTRTRRRVFGGQIKWVRYYTNKQLSLWLAETWNRIVFESSAWSSESKRETHKRVSTAWEQLLLRDGAVRYVAKHFSKAAQKKVPRDFRNVGRFWGASRSVSEAILPMVEIPMTSDQLEYILDDLDWHGMSYYEELGYWSSGPLFGVGELVLKNPDVFGFPDTIDYQLWMEQFLADDDGMDW